MRPQDTEFCSERDIESEKKDLPETIYLIPESSDEHGFYWAWCDDPRPTNDHIKSEAVRYVKA